MPTCPQCGLQSGMPTPFCGRCGARQVLPAEARPDDAPVERLDEPGELTAPIQALHVGVSDPHQPTPTMTLPPAPAPPYDARRAVPDVDWLRLVRGNWIGSALVAGVTLAVAGVLSVLLTAMAKPVDFGLDNSLTTVATVLAGTFGVDLVARLHVPGESLTAAVGVTPLTVTLIALTAGVLTFRRVTAGYRRLSDALSDAARAALLFGGVLVVVALLFRARSREFGRGWGNEIAHLFDARIAFGPSVPGSFLLGFAVLFVSLAASLWTRRDLWPARYAGAAEAVVPAAYGVATFLLLLPVAGLVGLVLMVLTGDTIQNVDPTPHDFFASLALAFGLLASGGYWLINLGAGGTFGSHSHTTGAPATRDYDRLGHFAGQDPGLWAAPLVMILVIGIATVVVARRTRSRETLQASLLSWVGLLFLTTPLLVRLTSLHAAVHAPDGSAVGAIGVNGWWAALLLPLAALGCATAVAASRRALDLSALRQAATNLQRDPAREV